MRRKGDTLERLFEAASELIGQHGYGATTVDEIAERARVAKGTVYYHFKSKAELVGALLDDGLRELLASFQAGIKDARSPQEALRALVHAEIDYISRHQAFSKMAVTGMWRVDQEWQESVQTLRERYLSVFAAVIESGVEAGAFRAGLDAAVTASALFGMVAAATLDWLVYMPARPRETVERELADLALSAVAAAT